MGREPPAPLLAWLTLLSTLTAGSGELAQLQALLKMRVVTAREPCSGAGRARGEGPATSLLGPGRE